MAFLKKLAVALGLASAFDGSVQAQDVTKDSWFSYVRQADGGPWITTINETLIEEISQSQINCFALIYHFRQDQLVNSIMPRPELSEQYYSLEDRIEALDFKPPARQAASMVGGGIRKTWYCSSNNQLTDAVKQLTKGFDQIPVHLVSASVAELMQLKPTSLERQLRGDGDILRNLASQGDDGSVPRQIMHWIYRTPAEKRLVLVSKLKSLDYKIEEDSDEKIRVSSVSTLSLESANHETIRFNQICDEFGCEYDGWETAIVKQ
jgi:hypothetical protein